MLSEEQLAKRREGVCGSDIAAVVGLSPYRSAFDVFLDKTGQGAPFVPNEHVDRGNFLEPALRQWYAHKTGAQVAEVGTIVHPQNKLVIATPDGVARWESGQDKALELKAPGPYAEGWGEPGTDQVPLHYLFQGAWQLAATELGACDVAALIDGELQIFPLVRDLELEAELIDSAQKFWRDYVKPKRAPPVKGLDEGWLKTRFPKDSGAVLEAASLSLDAKALVESYLERWKTLKVAEKDVKDLDAQVKATMGEATSISGAGWRIDWKLASGSTSTDYKAAFHELGGQNPGLAEELEKKHTRIGQPSRRFTPRILKGGTA